MTRPQGRDSPTYARKIARGHAGLYAHVPSPAMRVPAQQQAQQSAAVVIVLLGMCVCGAAARAFMHAHAARVAAWESDQWWWRQCADMEFYERVQDHMDVCDRLQIVSRDSLWGLAARDAAEALLTSLAETLTPSSALLVLGVAVASVAAAVLQTPARHAELPRRRPTV